jgi:head-tail adaptor
MRTQRTDSGRYNRPATIQAPAAYSDDGQGGNANAGQWTTVRSPMIWLQSATNPRYTFHRLYQYSQLYPEATHFAAMRYASDTAIDATMRLVVSSRVYQIIGAEDVNLEHVTTLLALIEYQAQGSK